MTSVSDSVEPRRAQGAMAQLDHDELVASQQQTFATPRRRYSIGARALFKMLDTVYGAPRKLSKFKVLELIARVPYQAWEQVAYIAITHTYERPSFAREIFDRVTSSRDQADNEQWHLLVLEEMIARDGVHEGAIKFYVIPQLVAFFYYQLSWILYVLRPSWSYRLNADFEDHAEHEYALLVQEHPEWEEQPFVSALADDYARVATIADLFRQIGYDERMHKDASVAAMRKPRF